jgi:hypothetical protein
MMAGRVLAFLAVGGFVYWYFWADRIRCEDHASQFSCSYLNKSATYEVWYWRNLQRDDETDNMLIGQATGLPQCKGIAMAHAISIDEAWNERAYICVLTKDGRRLEKHRL